MTEAVHGSRRRRKVDPAPLELPSHGVSPTVLRKRLAQARRADWDFSKGKIFGSMCTQPVPAALVAPAHFPTANLGNPGLCPGTARLEEEVVSILLHLFHAPSFGASGWVLSGGTEANITALWMARNATKKREVVLPESAHFSFRKAVDLLGLEPRWVPLDAQGRARPKEVRRALGPRTAAVVAVAGTTELGAVDPIEEIAELAQEHHVPLHVDAAFGGFVLPWLPATSGPPAFDLALEGVSSLAVDPHKMGMAPISSGALLVRRREMAQTIAVPSPYLSAPQAVGLLGTRASSAVAGTYAALVGLGEAGYRANVERCLGLTRRLLEGGRSLGLVPVVEPALNIVAFRHRNPLSVQTWMLERGWDISSVESPRALRFVVMPHATERTVAAMLRDLGSALRRFPA